MERCEKKESQLDETKGNTCCLGRSIYKESSSLKGCLCKEYTSFESKSSSYKTKSNFLAR